MNTDYNLYKIFLYLYEEKSISKTASKLYVSQPAISYSLKELETQLGYTLFHRNSKGIEPTTEAKELYSYISTAFNILNDAEEHIKNLNQLNTGYIRIGLPSYLGSFFIIPYISEFKKLFPGICFELVSANTTEMLDMLETRKLDLVLDILPVESKKNVTKITLAKLKNCLCYYKNSFGSLKQKKLENLEVPLILPGKNSSLRLKLDEYIESKNIKLQATVETWSSDMMLDLVRQGVGVGYSMKDNISSQPDKDSFEMIPLEEELPAVDICCLYINDFLTAASKKFIEKLKEKNK